MSPGNETRSGWTGGQYSLFRAIFGAYLCAHFVSLVAWGGEVFSSDGVLADAGASPLFGIFPNLFLIADGPLFVESVLVIGAVLGLMLAAGWKDRMAAVLLWLIWASLFGRNPLISNPSLPYVGLLLLVHAGLPTGRAAPYGALAMRGRVDPGGGWELPRELYRVVWILMSVGYSYSGYAKLLSPSWRDGTALARVLENPLARPGGLGALLLQLPEAMLNLATWGALGFELLFVLFALSARLRPFAWGAMLSMHLGLILLIDFADLSLGMVMLHLFTFNPAWLAPRRADQSEIVFYDGECGLCHRAVRFCLAEDLDGNAFRFAPLQGPSFDELVPEARRANLPDSIILLRADGALLERTDALAHMLVALGGVWFLVGHGLQFIPRPLRDAVYDAVANIRSRVFTRPEALCPMLPPHLVSRFLA